MRILSIDGGGIRGLIPARLVAELEARLGSPLFKHFDLVLGTSTGAILAAALTLPLRNGNPLPACELPDLYHRDGRRIFPTGAPLTSREKIQGRKGLSLRDELNAVAQRIGAIFGGNPHFGGGARHFDNGLVEVLRATLGSVRLREAMTGLRITSYDQLSSTPIVFSDVDDIEAFDAVRASGAAPTYFPPHSYNDRSLIDGGVWANNPALLALPELLADQASLLVSFGTGWRPEIITADNDHIRNWIQQSASALRFVTEGETTDFVLGRALTDKQYFRFQVRFPEKVLMDDPGPANLAVLDRAATELLKNSSQRLDQVVEAIR